MTDHAIVVKADARAMSAVTALDVRVNERWKPSNASQRTFGGKSFDGTSNCVSYYLDKDGNPTNVKLFRQRKVNRIPSRYATTPTGVADNQNAKRHIFNASDLAPIGNVL